MSLPRLTVANHCSRIRRTLSCWAFNPSSVPGTEGESRSTYIHEAAPGCCVLSAFALFAPLLTLPASSELPKPATRGGGTHAPHGHFLLLLVVAVHLWTPPPPRTHTGRQAPGGWRRGLTCLSLRASVVAQLAKNPPAMWETLVRSLGWADPLEKGMAMRFRIPAWRATHSVLDAS